jgi:hypothetical protein
MIGSNAIVLITCALISFGPPATEPLQTPPATTPEVQKLIKRLDSDAKRR